MQSETLSQLLHLVETSRLCLRIKYESKKREKENNEKR